MFCILFVLVLSNVKKSSFVGKWNFSKYFDNIDPCVILYSFLKSSSSEKDCNPLQIWMKSWIVVSVEELPTISSQVNWLTWFNSFSGFICCELLQLFHFVWNGSTRSVVSSDGNELNWVSNFISCELVQLLHLIWTASTVSSFHYRELINERLT
jgi:hypothetical protein